MILFTILRSMLCILKEAKVNITPWEQIYMVFIESVIPKIHFLEFISNPSFVIAHYNNKYQKSEHVINFYELTAFTAKIVKSVYDIIGRKNIL